MPPKRTKRPRGSGVGGREHEPAGTSVTTDGTAGTGATTTGRPGGTDRTSATVHRRAARSRVQEEEGNEGGNEGGNDDGDEDTVRLFCASTGAPPDTARIFMARASASGSGQCLNRAVDLFFDAEGDDERSRGAPPPLTLRGEQDAEFEEALRADRERERAREAEERERERAREAEERERERAREAADRVREAEERERREEDEVRCRKAAALPVEPAPDPSGAQVTLLLRDVREGGRVVRRFESDAALQTAFDVLDVTLGKRPGSYALVDPFPRRVFRDGTPGSLADHGVRGTCTLYVEAMHA